MSSLGIIFGLQPFEPKRTLILPCEDGEIRLYVLDGRAYPTAICKRGRGSYGVIQAVHFGGWSTPFVNADLYIPVEHLIEPESDVAHFVLEVAFRLVPRERGGQTAEAIAVSYDGGRTFYDNRSESCTILKEYGSSEPKTD